MEISKSNILQAKLKTIESKKATQVFKKTKEDTEKKLYFCLRIMVLKCLRMLETGVKYNKENINFKNE